MDRISFLQSGERVFQGREFIYIKEDISSRKLLFCYKASSPEKLISPDCLKKVYFLFGNSIYTDESFSGDLFLQEAEREGYRIYSPLLLEEKMREGFQKLLFEKFEALKGKKHPGSHLSSEEKALLFADLLSKEVLEKEDFLIMKSYPLYTNWADDLVNSGDLSSKRICYFYEEDFFLIETFEEWVFVKEEEFLKMYSSYLFIIESLEKIRKNEPLFHLARAKDALEEIKNLSDWIQIAPSALVQVKIRWSEKEMYLVSMQRRNLSELLSYFKMPEDINIYYWLSSSDRALFEKERRAEGSPYPNYIPIVKIKEIIAHKNCIYSPDFSAFFPLKEEEEKIPEAIAWK